MTSAILPFLTIPEGSFRCSPWVFTLSTGQKQEAPSFLDCWDNGTDLVISRSVSFDLEEILEQLKVSVGDIQLDHLVWVGTGDGRLPAEKWLVDTQRLQISKNFLEVKLHISGADLAGALFIEAAVIVSSVSGRSFHRLAPSEAGSIVWRERSRVLLEGNVSRFPIGEVNLGELFGEQWRDSLWYLHVNWGDLSVNFGAAVRLQINASNASFAKSFREGDPVTLQAVMADVMVQITSGYLRRFDDYEMAYGAQDETTLGGVAAGWLELAFGSHEAARRVFQSNSGKFHAHLSALAAPDGGQF